MKSKTINKIKKKGNKLVKKIVGDPLTKEYFKKQKKLTKDTIRKVVKRVEKKIDAILK